MVSALAVAGYVRPRQAVASDANPTFKMLHHHTLRYQGMRPPGGQRAGGGGLRAAQAGGRISANPNKKP